MSKPGMASRVVQNIDAEIETKKSPTTPFREMAGLFFLDR